MNGGLMRIIFRTSQMRAIQGRVGLLFLLVAWRIAGIADNGVTNEPPKRTAGWSYFHDELPAVPWSIHVFKIKRDHHELEFLTTLGNSNTLGMSTVSEQVRNLSRELGQPLAAVNG